MSNIKSTKQNTESVATATVDGIKAPASTVKGSPEAKAFMAEVREKITPECIQKGIETRQKTYAFRNAFEKALSLKYENPLGETAQMIYNKYRPNGLDNYADAIAIASVVKAANGDIDAAKFVRDTIGEKPADSTEHSGEIKIVLASKVQEYAQ